MANEARLKILLVATEAVPFAKEGGVADVIGSLPKALAELGHDVRIALPRYGVIDRERWGLEATGVRQTLWMGGGAQEVEIMRGALPDAPVTAYFVEHEGFFGRHRRLYLGLDQLDEQRRFTLFCRALLNALPALGFEPDIIHLNDWQTAACALYLRTSHQSLLRGGKTRIVYTIHNLQYQGRWEPAILDESGFTRAEVFTPFSLEYWGDVNWMKGGILAADAITTVSRRYAEEIQTLDHGWGLDETLFQRHSRLFGVPNGIDWDAWNPETDQDIAARYSSAAPLPTKLRNRTALRAEFGLPDEDETPVVGIVSRLVDQKGFDLLAEITEELGALPMQFVVLGTGHPRYEQLFRELSETTKTVRARIGFDNALSHRIYAGADFFLMPSAFEPGGLGQLIALRYGAIPIVRATGGLADTVTDVDAEPEVGNGLSFAAYDASALLATLRRAVALYAARPRWEALLTRAMGFDSRWAASARAYGDLYQRVLRLPPVGRPV